MGGFVTREGHHPIVTKAQLDQCIEGIRKIREEDIIDKSKGDTLSKVWTFVQVLWFAERYFARLRKHLPTVGLETVTIGFALIYGCTWWFWRKKPQGVSEAIQIDSVSAGRIQLALKLKANQTGPLCAGPGLQDPS
jgi:hypothetical protein